MALGVKSVADEVRLVDIDDRVKQTNIPEPQNRAPEVLGNGTESSRWGPYG